MYSLFAVSVTDRPIVCRLLMSYLAYASNMSFVFEDYTWSQSPLPWAVHDFALRPARIPLNAIISGPTAGGPMSEGSQSPVAVNAEFYQSICSGSEVQPYVLDSAYAPNDANGDVIIDWWTQQLASVQERCIEVDSTAHDLFDRLYAPPFPGITGTDDYIACSEGPGFYPCGNPLLLLPF